MEALENKVRSMQDKMEELLAYLNVITEDNFNQKYSLLVKLINEIGSEGIRINKDFDSGEIKKYHPDLLKTAKEISRKFDNIIENRNSELKSLSTELNSINNKRKLSKYTG